MFNSFYKKHIDAILPHVTGQKTLICIQGIPGAGKTTFGKLLANALKINQFEADQFWMEPNGKGELVYNFNAKRLHDAHQWCKNHVEIDLIEGKSVLVSNTSASDWTVRIYEDLAITHNANFYLIRLNTSYGTVHNTPGHIVESMRSSLAKARIVPNYIIS